eukprot:scaffold4031_cov129-Skeletonema_marinoi.AAC.4
MLWLPGAVYCQGKYQQDCSCHCKRPSASIDAIGCSRKFRGAHLTHAIGGFPSAAADEVSTIVSTGPGTIAW